MIAKKLNRLAGGGRLPAVVSKAKKTAVSTAKAQQLSPEMEALTERQRQFVWNFINRTDNNRSAAARDAGFSGTKGTAHKRASKLFNDPRVRAAIIVESRAKLLASAPRAIEALETIAFDTEHRRQVEALLAILNRGGLGERREIDVNLKHELTVIDKWRALVRGKMALGQPVEGLLENLTKQERDQVLDGLVLDAEFEEVKHASA